jgi:type IX secretion system PorP/SprF family membrane protein
MKLRIFIFTATLILGFSVEAQQLPESNLYSFNKYGINPAYTGYDGCLEAYASHLSQWVGIDGAPTTNYFSIHSGIGKNMGFGGGIILDNAAYVSRFSGRLSYAYRLKLGDDHNLRFGLSAGLYQLKIDATFATVDDLSDDVITGGVQRGMTFDSEFGLFYNLKNFQFGLSVPQIFETRTKLNFQDLDGFTGERHIVAFTSYNLELNEKYRIEPSVLYKTAQNGLAQVDFNALFTYNNLISIGGGYRTHIGPLARLGINIKDVFVLGYAYEFSGSNISAYSNGSHEIMLGMKLCKGQALEIEPVTLVEPILEEEAEVSPEVDQKPHADEDFISEEEIAAVDETTVKEEEDLKGNSSPPIKELEKELFTPIVGFGRNDAGHYNSAQNESLLKIAEALKSFPNQQVLIVGHSCDLGSTETNADISLERAQLIKAYLVNKGVNPDQLKVKGMADKTPLVPNTSESNRTKNRRVEFIIQ